MAHIEIQVTITERIEVPVNKYKEIKGKLEAGEITDRFQLLEATGEDFEFEYDSIEVQKDIEENVIELFDSENHKTYGSHTFN